MKVLAIFVHLLLASFGVFALPNLAAPSRTSAPSFPSPLTPSSPILSKKQAHEQVNQPDASPLSLRTSTDEAAKLAIPVSHSNAQAADGMDHFARSVAFEGGSSRGQSLGLDVSRAEDRRSRRSDGAEQQPVRMRRRRPAGSRRAQVHSSEAAGRSGYQQSLEPHSDAAIGLERAASDVLRAKRQDEPDPEPELTVDELSSESSDSDSSSDGASSDSDDASTSDGGASESEPEPEDESIQLDPSGVSTISSETRTIGFDEGQSVPTAGILSDPTGGQGELKLTMMWETVNEFETDIGKMTEKCLIPFDDPSQKFCGTSLNGVVLGGGTGIDGSSAPVPMVAATTSETATASNLGSPVTVPATDSTSTSSGTASESDILTSVSVPSTTLASSPPATSPTPSTSPIEQAETIPPINATVGETLPPGRTDSQTQIESLLTSAIPVSGSVTISASSADPSSTETAAAAAASEEAATVDIPGQKLQVLPIGLGIFGAVAGIAILVVLYVTYQRRKYKKQFRERTNALAEKVNRISARGGGGYGSAGES